MTSTTEEGFVLVWDDGTRWQLARPEASLPFRHAEL
jgi:hypothetical protein